MKQLFLDLEDTVIEPVLTGWHNASLLSADKLDAIRKLIVEEKANSIHLFSFALHNTNELKQFNRFVKKPLEDALDIHLATTFTVDEEILPIICRELKLHNVTFSEMVEFWGKQEAFRLFCKAMFKRHWLTWREEISVVLIDDSVSNETWSWPDFHLTGKMIRV